jgi:hypothetical protein
MRHVFETDGSRIEGLLKIGVKLVVATVLNSFCSNSSRQLLRKFHTMVSLPFQTR